MSMQRFFFSKLVTETNTFSNIPTTLASFAVAAGEAVFERSEERRVGKEC